MNSKELELSQKDEFESYLNELFAEMRENAAELQKNFEAELERHQMQINEASRLFAERLQNSQKNNLSLAQTFTEHLRLAKDSGAKLAALSSDEAEKISAEVNAAANYELMRNAINDISSKTSQSTILAALVEHSAKFAPRGVFFIVKNKYFTGWKRFDEDRSHPENITDVKFETGGKTVLDKAITALKTADADYSDSMPDRVFIDALNLNKPGRMYAIPLVVRGRSVAVLYVDYGNGGANLKIEALETLVKVAGLTVELLAASQTAIVQSTTVIESPIYQNELEPAENSIPTVAENSFSQPQLRLSELEIDLPIEVPEAERRQHNQARRFARLLVSEIKLYNEQKVAEGRESSDLYDRLREAIDRSREMYGKRVEPSIAAKFDYFHYELVNDLAEGQEAKLGNSYVAATVT